MSSRSSLPLAFSLPPHLPPLSRWLFLTWTITQARWLFLLAKIGVFFKHPPAQLQVWALSNPCLIISFTPLNYSSDWCSSAWLRCRLVPIPNFSYSGRRKWKTNPECSQDSKPQVKLLAIYGSQAWPGLTSFSYLLLAHSPHGRQAALRIPPVGPGDHILWFCECRPLFDKPRSQSFPPSASSP